MNLPTGRRIFMLDGTNDVDSRKDVFFLGGGSLLILLPIWGMKYPKPPILGREQAFSRQTGKISKVSCYRNYCIDFSNLA